MMRTECEQENQVHPHHNNQENKVSLKFKIRKQLDSSPEVADGSCSSPENIISNNTTRVCPQCNKEFGSGKALGGHMRIHAQAIKKQQKMISNRNQPIFSKNQSDPRSDSDNSMSDQYCLMKEQTVCCSVCGKKFVSMKSLFGHMRCHPERDWRGIQPPLENNSSSLSEHDSEDDDEEEDNDDDGKPVNDCLQSLPSMWGTAKGRRGQKGTKRDSPDVSISSSDEDDEEEMRLRNAVNDLMLLKRLDCSDSSGLSTLGAAAAAQKNTNGVDQHHLEDTNGNSWTVNNRGEEFDHVRFKADDFEQVSKDMKGSYSKVDDYPVMKKMRIEEGGSTDHVMKDYIGCIGHEGNAAASHVVENHVVDDDFEGRNTGLLLMNNGSHKYFDGINNKENHREMVMGNNKNNKAKKMKLMMDINPEKPAAAAGGSVQVAVSTTTEKYKCTICNKSFSSHQALGGHKSSHNKFKLTIINADNGTNNHPPHQPLSVSAFAPPDLHLVRNAEFNQSHHQLSRSPDQVNMVISEERARKRNSIDEVAGSSKADHISMTHQCSVCNKIFPSGQALGGHKRCHWTAPADDQTQAPAPAPAHAHANAQAQSAVTASGEQAITQASGRQFRLFGFDVDVPPMEGNA